MSSIKDNYSNGSVGEFLKNKINGNSNLSFVTAYFTIYAYERLRNELDNIDSLRLLFGEPRFINLVSQSTDPKNYKIEDEKLIIPIESRLQQKQVAVDCSNWIKRKVEIKSMVKPDFLHGKLYHIQQSNGVEEAITGSSNFTVNGLGLGNKPNIELNMVINDKRDLCDLKAWFDKLWNNNMDDVKVKDVKNDVLKYLEQLYIENEPEFIYFKTLYHIFEKYIEEEDKGGLLTSETGFFETEIWNALYDFQKDGVRGAINKILKHNGCIIADSVGLGKTFEALAVIQYFQKLNQNILVLCPKKLRDNWTVYQAGKANMLNPFKRDRYNYTLLYHTDMGRKVGRSDADGIDFQHFNWGAYDLVVIDESHNFRGNPVDRKTKEGDTVMNRAKWLMEQVIKAGPKTKVLLLTATPVNNNLRDLRNQIYLITEGKPSAMYDATQIKDIGLTLKNAQTKFTNWADNKKNPKRTLKQLLESYLDSDFIKLLDEITIARSRRHIENFYKENLASIGNFPLRLKPNSVYPDIDLKRRFPTYDKINKEILKYKLSVYNPSAYVKNEFKQKYEEIAKTQGVLGFTQAQRERYLIGMMKVNFLKRLESSIQSFEISMERTIEKIETLEEKIKDFIEKKLESKVESLDSMGPDEAELEESEDDLEQWQVGKKLKFDLADLNLDKWLDDLAKDKEALYHLWVDAKAVGPKDDAKLKELKDAITEKIKNPLNVGNKKVLLFTAFSDTAKYLYENLKEWYVKTLGLNIALVTGSYTQSTFGRNDYSNILTNFSPKSKNRALMSSMPQDKEIDLLIATDCISEGQNLQDCDCLINYDIHWNPVRIIQRFGRIDRLGSKNKVIQLINFWPTKDLDNYINLKERVEARMALVDVTATGEDNILNTEQLEELITDDLKFRNKQLKKLQTEVLDLEQLDESVSLTDFTLDDFRIDLMHYIEANRAKLERAPFGLYTVVPSPSDNNANHIEINRFSIAEKEIIKPGVVYCLKQKGNTEGNEEVNPLQPYFLVYIRDDGTVRYNYTNAKQILEIYRLMCQGRAAPFNELCELFNAETNQGKKMKKYTDLLIKAIDEISKVFRKKAGAKLTSDRGAVLIPKEKQINNLNDFELVTWLVIK